MLEYYELWRISGHNPIFESLCALLLCFVVLLTIFPLHKRELSRVEKNGKALKKVSSIHLKVFALFVSCFRASDQRKIAD
jgi:hypothetical protein